MAGAGAARGALPLRLRGHQGGDPVSGARGRRCAAGDPRRRPGHAGCGPLTAERAQGAGRRWRAGRSSTTSSRCCARQGIRRVVLCLGHLGEQVEAHVGDGAAPRAGGRVLLRRRPRLLGTGGRAAPRRCRCSATVLLGAVRRLLPRHRLRAPMLRATSSAAASRGLHDRAPQRRTAGTASNVVFRDGRLRPLRQGPAARRTCTTSITGVALLRRAALERDPAGPPVRPRRPLPRPGGRRG